MQHTPWGDFCWKPPCYCCSIKDCLSGIGIYSAPVKVIFAENRLAIAVPSRTAFLAKVSVLHPLTEKTVFLRKTKLVTKLQCFVSYSIQSRFFTPKRNPKVDICRGLYSGPDATEFSINMILLGPTGFITKVLVTNVLCIVTGFAKPTGS